MTLSIPLSQLTSSASNVRKSGGASIEDLAGSIQAHGLLQNLSVVEIAGKYQVVAGNRRLQALQLLAKEGALADDHPVACRIVTSAEAAEISLAENVVRQAMHPADEFEAFRALAKESGFTSAEIAVRFGTSEKHVEQRFRLGNVAPSLLAEYRAGKATLDQMMALALVDDHPAQMKAWKAGEHALWLRSPQQLRQALVEKDIGLDSTLGRFVGVDAYEKAGGKTRKDLFSDFASLPDSKLVNKLALAKLEAEAAKQRAKGWGWAEARLSFDYSEKAKYKQGGDGKPDPKLGVIVTISHNGNIDVHKGMVKPGEKAPASKKKAGANKPKGDGTRETNDKLYGVRTAILRRELREDGYMARTCLAAAMAAQFFTGKWSEPAATLIVLEAMPYAPSTIAQAIKATDPKGIQELAEWAKKIDAGVKQHGSILAWLIKSENNHLVDKLLAIMAAELILADDTQEPDVHAFAKVVGVTFAEHWQLSQQWLSEQAKPYIVTAVTEACGADKAKPLDKLTGKPLAAAAYPLLAAANWIPQLLRAPAPPKPAPKKAAKKAMKKAAVKK
jgi:ParB family chromosome partitioning protein